MKRCLKGFTLIELIIGMALIALLMMLAAPSYRTWILNTNIRGATEGALAVLQSARAEAVRRNLQVEFVLTNSDPVEAAVNALVPNPAGRNFVVRIFQPGGAYTAEDFVQGGHLANQGNSTQLALQRVDGAGNGANAQGIIFNSLGQASAVRTAGGLVTNHAAIRIDASDPAGGNCIAVGTTDGMRCLRVQISRGGGARMCDPSVVSSTDPRAC